MGYKRPSEFLNHLSQTHLDFYFLFYSVVSLIRKIPRYGEKISDPFVEYISQQKAHLHNKTAWSVSILSFEF